jgi:hypothetical protein
VIGDQPLLVARRVLLRQGVLDQQVVEDHIMESDDPRAAKRQLQDLPVVDVVPHLVEGKPAFSTQNLGRRGLPQALQIRRQWLPGQANDPQVTELAQVWQQIAAVVGDP